MNTIFTGLLAAAVADTERQWSDLFFGLDQDQRFVLLIVAIGCVTGIIIATVGIISGAITTVHRRRHLADLKREMLDRGMPADEIARIVEASPPEDALSRWAACWGKKK
jgi:hypothetical protein